jgi:uncharacterized protein YjbJ (UPF0337 family)
MVCPIVEPGAETLVRQGGPTCPAGHAFHYRFKEKAMNTDQVKGAAKDIAGKVQEEAGKVTGSTEQQAKGLEKQVEGKGQGTLGDAKEVIKGK